MLICLSIDHHRADLNFLEQVQRHSSELKSVLSNSARGSAVLATCNRFEAYLDVDEHSEAHLANTLGRMSEVTGLPTARLADVTVVKSGEQAAEHLFAVSSGLESAIVGEGEIAGQVRRTLERSRESGTVTPTLERLFQTASRTSREVKQRTGIQSAGRSLVRLALAMVDSRIGDWRAARILLIGTGAYAGASLAAVRARGAQHIGVYSPSGRAEAFAASHGIDPVFDDELDDVLIESDVVVACTSTHDPLLVADQFQRTSTVGRQPFCTMLGAAAHTRAYPRPRMLIDMGLPRNIDPAVAEVPGVELLDLEIVALHAPIPELSAEAEARKIVRDATAEFVSSGAEQGAVSSLVALREYVQGILQDELGRIGRGRPVDPAIESALKHLTGRLLHRPTVRLREAARDGRAADAERAVDLLFGS
ncbi:MAG: glutamyl-tRNA reductase [Leucobacter sp.]